MKLGAFLLLLKLYLLFDNKTAHGYELNFHPCEGGSLCLLDDDSSKGFFFFSELIPYRCMYVCMYLFPFTISYNNFNFK